MITKPNEKVLARTLYFETNQTQSEIAETLSINPKTLYLWMKEGEWSRLKKAARQAPAIIVDDLYEQLTELNSSIRSRPAGSRFPTREEAEISRKLILSIDKIKKQATLSDNIQVMKSFTSYMQNMHPDLAKQVTLIADDFIKGRATDDSHPYEMDYQYDDNRYKNVVQDELVTEETISHLQVSEEQHDDHVSLPEKNETEITEANVEEQPQHETAPLKYREGIEEIFDPNLSPLYYKQLKVGNITVSFGKRNFEIRR